jgi:hypothetical protein
MVGGRVIFASHMLRAPIMARPHDRNINDAKGRGGSFFKAFQSAALYSLTPWPVQNTMHGAEPAMIT